MFKSIIFDFNRTIYNPDNKELFSDSVSILRILKSIGLKLGLISSGNIDRKELIRNLGLLSYFDWWKVVPKKEAKHFLGFVDSFNFKNNEVLVVGDLITSEIKIANKLGMKTVWLKKGKFTNVRSLIVPDFEIKSLDEVVSIVKNNFKVH